MNSNKIEWKEVELGEVCQILSGSTPSTIKEEYWNGDINWITPAEISNSHNWYYSNTIKKISKKGLESSSINLFPKGTVMLTSRAPIGKVAIAGTEMCSNQGFKNFICDKKILDPEYLYYWLRMNVEYLNSLGRGATFKEISKSIVSKIKIPLPPISTQKAIVSILEKAESLKKKREEADKLTKEYLQSVFYEMFYNKKFPYQKINNIILEIKNRNSKKENSEEEFEYIDISSIDNSLKRISSTSKILWKNSPSRAKQEVKNKDIIISTVRPNLNAVAIIPNELNGQICSTGFCVLRANTEKVIPEYLFMNSIGKIFINSMSKIAKGASYPAISNKDILNFEIPLPPINLQQKFASIVEQVEKLKEKQKESKEEIGLMFDSLMQKAFNGELVR